MPITEAASIEANKLAGEALETAVNESVTRMTAQNASGSSAMDAKKMIEGASKPDPQKAEQAMARRREAAFATGCEVCMHAVDHGWWGKSLPPGWTHCSECHTSWSGAQVWGHCSKCHQTFRGVGTFDAHHEAKACIAGLSGPPHRGTRASWGGRDYIVKHQEKGDLLYWGSADEIDPSVFGGNE